MIRLACFVDPPHTRVGFAEAPMLKSVHGVFRNGKVELLEPAPGPDETQVLVTFLEPSRVDLRQRGISES